MNIFKTVRVERNNEFILVTSCLNGMLSMTNPYQEFVFYPVDISNEKLGFIIREKLTESKELKLDEFQKIFKSNDMKGLQKRLEFEMIIKYGYKSKRDIYKNMSFIDINIIGNILEIVPSHQDGLSSSTAIHNKDGSALLFNYHSNISNDELGFAVREAFKYCTSIYRR